MLVSPDRVTRCRLAAAEGGGARRAGRKVTERERLSGFVGRNGLLVRRRDRAARLLTVVGLTVVVIAVQIGASRGQSPSGGESSALVMGRVVQDLSSFPVANALVTLRQRAATGTARITMTDASGDFVLFDLPSGIYRLTAEKPGFLSGEYGERFMSHEDDVGWQSLEIAEGQHIAGIVVPLWRSAAITGVLTDDLGDPAVGVTVTATAVKTLGGRLLAERRSHSSRSDDRGYYRLSGLLPGSYLTFVQSVPTTLPRGTSPPVSVPGGTGPIETGDFALQFSNAPVPPHGNGQDGLSVYPTLFYPDSERPTDQSIVRIGSGEERAGVDLHLRLEAARKVVGRLSGLADAGPAGLTIRLLQADQQSVGPSEVATTIAAPDGAFALLGVPAGSYVLEASDTPLSRPAGGGRAGAYSGPALSDGWVASERITVGDADVLGFIVPVRRKLPVAGTILFSISGPSPSFPGTPLVSVEVSSWEGDLLGSLVPNGDGRFLCWLPAGTYFVNVVAPMLIQHGLAIQSVTTRGRDAIDVPVAVDSSSPNEIAITVTDHPTVLSGTVRSSGNIGDGDAMVLVFPATRTRWTGFGPRPSSLRSTRVRENGSYDLTGLPEGDYLVAAIKAEFVPDWRTPEKLEALSRVARQVHLAAGGRLTVDLLTSTVR